MIKMRQFLQALINQMRLIKNRMQNSYVVLNYFRVQFDKELLLF